MLPYLCEPVAQMEWYSLLPFSSSVLRSLCVPWSWEWNMLSDPAPSKQVWVLGSHLPLTRDRAFFVVLLTCALAPATVSLHRYLMADSFCRPSPSSRFLLLKEESSSPGSPPSPQRCLLFYLRQHHQEASFLSPVFFAATCEI